jgi:hypothetical protein
LQIPCEVRREMGCTRRELVGWLRDAGYLVDEATGTVIAEGARIGLSIREQSPRGLGALTLPVLQVTFLFDGVEAAVRDAFLARFDLYTRRGGG